MVSMRAHAQSCDGMATHNLLAHAAVARNFLSLRTTKLLCAGIES
jgi:hypothetical protein